MDSGVSEYLADTFPSPKIMQNIVSRFTQSYSASDVTELVCYLPSFCAGCAVQIIIYKLKYTFINTFLTNEQRGLMESHKMLLGPWGGMYFIISFIYMCSVATAQVIFYSHLLKSFSNKFVLLMLENLKNYSIHWKSTQIRNFQRQIGPCGYFLCNLMSSLLRDKNKGFYKLGF